MKTNRNRLRKNILKTKRSGHTNSMLDNCTTRKNTCLHQKITSSMHSAHF